MYCSMKLLIRLRTGFCSQHWGSLLQENRSASRNTCYLKSDCHFKFKTYSTRPAFWDNFKRETNTFEISTLKPYPEWRNVAAGPIWEEGYYERVWQPYIKSKKLAVHIEQQDKDWKKYEENYGMSPSDYLDSADYKELYQNNLVWANYFRNKRGGIQKQKTRKNCMRSGVVSTGSPCPICRDEKLLLSYHNIALLKQFIDEQTGNVHSELRTGICQIKNKRLHECFEIAMQYGYLPRNVHFVQFTSSCV
uniref:Small ribosomal subunit protein mS40 n=1 Tax=Phallusia mammillata TaxID=59560 RepID=A0A6F9DLY3_9ASCI|nr:28S ribosomal protein S18b, mitochondrial-like [Phallusia mammillata]